MRSCAITVTLTISDINSCMNIVQASHDAATDCTCRVHGIARERGGAG